MAEDNGDQPDPVVEAKAALDEAAENLRQAEEDHRNSESAQNLKAAQATHAELKALHDELTKEPPAEKGKHLLVDFVPNGSYVKRDLPEEYGGLYPRQLFLDGVNIEQVGEVDGVRTYRRM